MHDAVAEAYGISSEEVDKKITKAMAYHGPRNYEMDSIKQRLGVDKLFSEFFPRGRFYFKFHGTDLRNIDHVMARFKHCRNYRKYSALWKANAPKDIRMKGVYLLALTKMTHSGMENERRQIAEFIKDGHDVRESTYTEDYVDGVDVWVDGNPVQIKSPATMRGMGL